MKAANASETAPERRKESVKVTRVSIMRASIRPVRFGFENGLFAPHPQGRPGLHKSLNRAGVAASWPPYPSRTSHIRVIRAAPAFRGNPGDVPVGVLDIAGFAMNAILGVDHVFRLRA